MSSNNKNNNNNQRQQPLGSTATGPSPISPHHYEQQEMMTTLQRPPSLLAAGLPSTLASSPNRLAPPRPRRLWAVNDTSCRPIPRFYPKLDPKCTVFVTDASPSVVAVRISECLRKRSISAEYDEEAVIATCMTVDRCHFVIHMYQGSSKAQPPMKGVDFSHGVIVECVRISGSVLTFHRHCRGILQAAKGQSTGDDRRPNYATSVLEFRRLKSQQKQNIIQLGGRSGISAAHALEQARELLKKDRLECRQLGMERLVGLTEEAVSGEEISSYVSTQLLKDLWILEYLKETDAKEPNEKPSTGNSLMSACTSTLFDVDSGLGQSSSDAMNPPKVEEEARHDGMLRASALRVLCNSLSVAAENKVLDRLVCLPGSQLESRSLLDVLIQDLKGATRPPSIVMAEARLPSVHEAALAVRCLRILGEHSERCEAYLQREHVLERLEMARASGRSTHWVLQDEAEFTYSKLTEDVRSC